MSETLAGDASLSGHLLATRRRASQVSGCAGCGLFFSQTSVTPKPLKTAPNAAHLPGRGTGTPESRRQRSLLKTAALQSAVQGSATFSSIATDEHGVIQLFNVGAERMLGYSAAEVVNRLTPAHFFAAGVLTQRAQALSAEFGVDVKPGFDALAFKASRGIEDIHEVTCVHKDGTRQPTLVSVTALRDAQRQLIGYLLIGTDNTARKQAEAVQEQLDQRLRDQQFYARSLFEAIEDALITTDPQGVISDVNEQAERMTGRNREALIGTPFQQFFTDPERAQSCIDRVLSENKVTNYELTARAVDRRETVVSCNATPFYDRDRALRGVIVAARDVSVHKRLDLALQSAKLAAERANQAKSDFLSSMSHELRSPLNAILGFAQLLESGSPAPTPLQKDSIGQILQAGWYLLELINEVLDLALSESGRLSLSMEPLLLSEVLADCQAMIEPQAQKGGISVNFNPVDSQWAVNADRTRVKQIFINLLSNAIKYNRVGGSVEVSCQRMPNERTRISFQDTGEGLSPEKLAQLFQPFNRLGQEAGVEEGTGIGLVVCKKLAHLIGGEIGVLSTVGVGSLFWVDLLTCGIGESPDDSTALAGKGGALASSEALPAGPLPRRTVLCVEDNPANLLLVSRLLSRRPDIRLLSAKDGRRGIELARQAQPDVILMDINLPGISGLEALRLLAADNDTAHIPVIAVSANAMPRDIEKGLQAGFFRYLTKPIRVEAFMAALDLALLANDTAAEQHR